MSIIILNNPTLVGEEIVSKISIIKYVCSDGILPPGISISGTIFQLVCIIILILRAIIILPILQFTMDVLIGNYADPIIHGATS